MKSRTGGPEEGYFHEAKGCAEPMDEAKPPDGALPGRYKESGGTVRPGGVAGCRDSVMTSCARLCCWSSDFGFMMHLNQSAGRREFLGLNEFGSTKSHQQNRYVAR